MSDFLVGLHNYDMLMDQKYIEKFLYMPCWYPQRSNFALSEFAQQEIKKTSFDIVRIVCNLAYIEEERARKMVFKTDYIYRERL